MTNNVFHCNKITEMTQTLWSDDVNLNDFT